MEGGGGGDGGSRAARRGVHIDFLQLRVVVNPFRESARELRVFDVEYLEGIHAQVMLRQRRVGEIVVRNV